MKNIATIAAVVIATALGVYFGSGQNTKSVTPPEIAGLVYPKSRPIESFTLVDQDGEVFNNASLSGKWSFLYFGYTFCPDICPVTLNHFKDLNQKLKKTGKNTNVEFMLVSVDPARDTPERLKEYIAFFDSDFNGASGEEHQLSILTKSMAAVYIPIKDPQEENYLVDHSSTVVLVNPDGKLHAVFTTPHSVESFDKGFNDILAHWEVISAP